MSRDPVSILLVEDNPGDARLVTENLRGHVHFPYTMSHAETLADALERLQRSEPDLVLLDLSLPDSQGMATVRAVRDVTQRPAVVVLTGSDDQALAVEALELGAQDYLVKGVQNGDYLERAIRFAMGRRSLFNSVQQHARQLEEVSAELTAVLDGAPIPMLVVDADGIVRRVNRAAAEFAERSIEEMLGLRGGDALRCLRATEAPHGCGSGDACVTCPIRTAVHRTLEAGKGLRQLDMTMELEAGPLGSRQVQLEVSTSPVETARGQMVVVSVEDVSERVRAAEAVRRSEERLKVLIGNLRGLVYRCTMEPGWPMSFVSDAFEDLTGYRPGDLAEDGRVRFDRVIHPDDRQAVWDAVRSSGPGEPFEVEYRIVTRDGGVRWVWERGQNVGADDAGRVVLEGFITDVTNRRRAEEALQASEQRYRHLFERNQAGVFRSTLDGRILACNEAFARIFGMKSPEHAKDLEAHQLYTSRQEREHFVEEVRRHGHLVNHEMRGRRLDGEEVWLLENVGLVQGEDGEKLLEGTLIDITERRQMEEQLHQAQKMEAVGQLAGGVAHDFNNLLQALGGLVEEACDQTEDGSPLEGFLGEMASLVERGARLTRQLLLFSRQETARPEVLDLNEVVRTSEALLRRLLREDIRLETRLVDGPAVIEADRGQLGQVIMNLAVNAADAMPGGGRLQLAVSAANGHVLLEVSDTGHGIPQEVVDRVFEPFFTTKERGKGTGLGLSVVHGIVAACGGTVDVSTRKGEGTTFHIRLPRSARTVKEQREDVAAESRPAAADTPMSGRVLVVDDEPAVREILRRMLVRQGFQVDTAGTVAEGLETVNGGLPELVVSDMVLPDGNGMDLIAKLRERQPDLPAVLVSGYTEEEARVHDAEASGSVCFLQKPFSMGDLTTTVREALGARPSSGDEG